MKAKKSSFVIKILKQNGFVLVRTKGSHVIYKKDNCMVIIPYHGSNKEIPIGTLLSIIKQSGIDKKNFE